MLQIIGGLLKGKTLQGPKKQPHKELFRPSSGRLREALFNLLMNKIEESRFLDLFAGSGAIGLEAISRGAQSCCFVESNRDACIAIKGNIAKLEVQRKCRLIEAKVPQAITKLKEPPFDLIFADPPYPEAAFLLPLTLKALKESQLIAQEALLALEMPSELKSGDIALPDGLSIIDERRYGLGKLLLVTDLENTKKQQ